MATRFPVRSAVLLTLLALPGAGAATQRAPLAASAQTAAAGTLDALVAGSTFAQSSVPYFLAAREQTQAGLRRLGFQQSWQEVYDGQTIMAWYSGALNLTVLCLQGWSYEGLTHRAVLTAGQPSSPERVFW